MPTDLNVQKPRWPHSDGTIKDSPSTRVLTVLARISERGCQTLDLHSITTKKEMTCFAKQISAVQEQSKAYFSVKGFLILITERLAGKVSTFLSF